MWILRQGDRTAIGRGTGRDFYLCRFGQGCNAGYVRWHAIAFEAAFRFRNTTSQKVTKKDQEKKSFLHSASVRSHPLYTAKTDVVPVLIQFMSVGYF